MVVVIGVIAVMPFTMNFQSVFKGVGIAEHHSAFYQLCILWGIPVFMVIVFWIILKRTYYYLERTWLNYEKQN